MDDRSERFKFEPDAWFVFFNGQSDTWWVQRWVPGRFKHVDAVGYCRSAGCWLWVEMLVGRMSVSAVPDDDVGREMLAKHRAARKCLLVVPKTKGRVYRPALNCVTALAHLMGSTSGALLPDRLWRDLLAEGAQEI
jgi:hypothetical protein